MTMLAARMFASALTASVEGRLGPHFDANLAGHAADHLAREHWEGLRGLLEMLESEALDGNERERSSCESLHAFLMSVWVSPSDEVDLKRATGKGRDEWLGLPIWTFRSAESPAYVGG